MGGGGGGGGGEGLGSPDTCKINLQILDLQRLVTRAVIGGEAYCSHN